MKNTTVIQDIDKLIGWFKDRNGNNKYDNVILSLGLIRLKVEKLTAIEKLISSDMIGENNMLDIQEIKKIVSDGAFTNRFMEIVSTDTELMDVDKIVKIYNGSDKYARAIINSIFISLTGYQLTTIINNDSQEGVVI